MTTAWATVSDEISIKLAESDLAAWIRRAGSYTDEIRKADGELREAIGLFHKDGVSKAVRERPRFGPRTR